MPCIVVGAPAQSFLPSGMTKSGASPQLGGSFAQVTGAWAPDTANYPGSTVSGFDLVIQSSGTGITVSTSVVWTNDDFSSRSVTMRLKLGTTVIATGSAFSVPAAGSATGTLSAPDITVVAGDLVRLEAMCNVTNAVSAEVNPASYVRALRP